MTLSDLVWASRLLLAALFAVAAAAKIMDGTRLRASLVNLHIPDQLLAFGRWGVVAVEVCLVAVLLLADHFVAGMATFTAFAVFIVLLSISKDGMIGCGCFGSLAYPSPSRRLRPIYWRAAGAIVGLLIAGMAIDTTGSPSHTAVLLAAGGISLAVLKNRADKAPLRRHPVVEADAERPGVAMLRRDFLRRVIPFTIGAAGFVIPLARAYACGGGSTFCSTGFAAEASSATASPAHSENDPCFRSASIFKVTGDCQASDQFDSCAATAGADNTKLLGCADAFRMQLIACKQAFEDKAAACF